MYDSFLLSKNHGSQGLREIKCTVVRKLTRLTQGIISVLSDMYSQGSSLHGVNLSFAAKPLRNLFQNVLGSVGM